MNIQKILMIITIGLSSLSCNKFLELDPQGVLSESVLQDATGVEALLTGAYGALHGVGNYGDFPRQSSPDNWVYGSLMGGDAHKGGGGGIQTPLINVQNGDADPTINYFNTKWRAVYDGISRCNAVLQLVGKVNDMTEAQKAKAMGEARFLRGHFYSDLKKMFNMVPWIDETTTDFNQPNDRDIWPDIEADFQFAVDNLPATQAQRGRVNKWAAAAYLARTYSYQHKWPQAKVLLDDIVVNGVTSEGIPYNLVAKYRDVFEPVAEAGNPETVFAIQSVTNQTPTNRATGYFGSELNWPTGGPSTCCGTFQPTQDLVNSFRTNSAGLPFLADHNNQPVANDMGMNSTMPFQVDQQPMDPRVDWTAGRRGVPYLDWGPMPGKLWVRDQSDGGPYIPIKHIYRRSRRTIDSEAASTRSTAVNIHIIRFADVLLMAAEAEVEAGTLEKATEYVNRVRRRAANTAGFPDAFELNKLFAKAVVSNAAAMTSLTGIVNYDWVVREDTRTTFMYLGGGSGTLSNWNEYKPVNYHVGEYPVFSNKEAAKERIYFERKLELAMEGQRFFDLVRWGVAEELLNDFFSYEKTFISTRDGKFTPGKNEYFPIPQTQIDMSIVNGVPRLKQNPGYN
jgi:hypothetical protein